MGGIGSEGKAVPLPGSRRVTTRQAVAKMRKGGNEGELKNTRITFSSDHGKRLKKRLAFDVRCS
jgi:hypothetical protein